MIYDEEKTTLGIPFEEFKKRMERETKILYAMEQIDADTMRDMGHRLSILIDEAEFYSRKGQ